MKAKYLFALLLIVAAGSGCRLRKSLARQESLLERRSEARLEAHHEGLTRQETRQITWREDSAGHSYRVTIIPLDTVRVEPGKGFTGKASRIELEGLLKSGSRSKDSLATAVQVNTHTRTRQETGERLSNREKQVAKTKETSRSSWWMAGMLAAMAAGWWLRARFG